MLFRIIPIFFVFFLLLFNSLSGQTARLTGSDICSDGIQVTSIGISGMNPNMYYALYRDGEMLQVRRSAGSGSDHSFSFGDYKDVGTYTAYAFDDAVAGFPVSKGKAVAGKVSIWQTPVLQINDTLKIKSGEVLKIEPRVDGEGATVTWSGKILTGNVTGITKKGNGGIHDILKLVDGNQALVIYSLTPINPQYSGSCMGTTRDLIVIVNP